MGFLCSDLFITFPYLEDSLPNALPKEDYHMASLIEIVRHANSLMVMEAAEELQFAMASPII